MAKWKGIVGKGFTAAEFEAYVSSIKLSSWRPSFVVTHNTSEPSAALYRQWQARANWTGEGWLKNLESYYSGMGWSGGPHLFVAPDKIWAFTPLTMPGTHSPAWNSITWGVETVGEFDSEPFAGPVRDNLISALATLHIFAGLNPVDYVKGVRGLHFHKEDPVTTHKDCPGKNMVKPDVVASVSAEMQARNGGGHGDVPIASQATDPYVPPAPTKGGPSSDDSNTSIYWVQQQLNRWIVETRQHIAPLQMDGMITKGGKTYSAVQSFQREHRLVVDGIPGPLTRAALRSFT